MTDRQYLLYGESVKTVTNPMGKNWVAILFETIFSWMRVDVSTLIDSVFEKWVGVSVWM